MNTEFDRPHIITTPKFLKSCVEEDTYEGILEELANRRCDVCQKPLDETDCKIIIVPLTELGGAVQNGRITGDLYYLIAHTTECLPKVMTYAEFIYQKVLVYHKRNLFFVSPIPPNQKNN